MITDKPVAHTHHCLHWNGIDALLFLKVSRSLCHSLTKACIHTPAPAGLSPSTTISHSWSSKSLSDRPVPTARCSTPTTQRAETFCPSAWREDSWSFASTAAQVPPSSGDSCNDENNGIVKKTCIWPVKRDVLYVCMLLGVVRRLPWIRGMTCAHLVRQKMEFCRWTTRGRWKARLRWTSSFRHIY